MLYIALYNDARQQVLNVWTQDLTRKWKMHTKVHLDHVEILEGGTGAVNTLTVTNLKFDRLGEFFLFSLE